MINRTTLLLLMIFLLFSCSEQNNNSPEVQAPLQAEILMNLSDPAIDIDYLVIAPEALINAGRKLCSYRNLDTDDDVNEAAVISLSSIVELYPGDTIAAITSFLSTEPHEWKALPKYVVLLGDEKLNSGSAGIPVFKVPKGEPNRSEFYDNIYLDPDKDETFDYIVARIPIRSEKEMDLYISKVKNYMMNSNESIFFATDNSLTPSFPEWMKINGYDYDIPNEFPISSSKSRSQWNELPFNSYTFEMMTPLGRIGWDVEKYNTENFLDDCDDLLRNIQDSSTVVSVGETNFFENRVKARADFFKKANGNHKLQVYLGHASPETFTVEALYNYKDTSSFTTPSVILHLGCYSAEFTSDSSMTRKLMFSSKGGTVALLGCPYTNYVTPGTNYIQSFLSDFAQDTNATVGEIFSRQLDRRDSDFFILLGDPAIRIN